jgi:hypothetical protein
MEMLKIPLAQRELTKLLQKYFSARIKLSFINYNVRQKCQRILSNEALSADHLDEFESLIQYGQGGSAASTDSEASAYMKSALEFDNIIQSDFKDYFAAGQRVQDNDKYVQALEYEYIHDNPNVSEQRAS